MMYFPSGLRPSGDPRCMLSHEPMTHWNDVNMLLYKTRMLRWVHQQDVRGLLDVNRHSWTREWPDYLHIPDVQTNQRTLCDTWPCNASKSWLIDQTVILIVSGDSEIADTHSCSCVWVCNQCVIGVAVDNIIRKRLFVMFRQASGKVNIFLGLSHLFIPLETEV